MITHIDTQHTHQTGLQHENKQSTASEAEVESNELHLLALL